MAGTMLAYNAGRQLVGHGKNRSEADLCEFPVGGISVVIRQGTIEHIFKGHEGDFLHAIGGATDFKTKENNVSLYIKELIISSSELFVTRSNEIDSLLIHFKELPWNGSFYRYVIAHEEGSTYFLVTAFKLEPNWSYIRKEKYKSASYGRQIVYTAAIKYPNNPHIARVRGSV